MGELTIMSPWWWSTDEERYRGPCNSRAEAIMEAYAEGEITFWVMQAEHVQLACDLFEADELAERFDERNEEAADGDGDPLSSELPTSAWESLSAVVERELKGLVRKHGVAAWAFSTSSKPELISLATPILAALPAEAQAVLADLASAWKDGGYIADSYVGSKVERLRVSLGPQAAT